MSLLYFALVSNVIAAFSFLIRADLNLVHSNTEVLVKVGLGERADEDFLLARDTCVVLLKLGGSGKVRNKIHRSGVFHSSSDLVVHVVQKETSS